MYYLFVLCLANGLHLLSLRIVRRPMRALPKTNLYKTEIVHLLHVSRNVVVLYLSRIQFESWDRCSSFPTCFGYNGLDVQVQKKTLSNFLAQYKYVQYVPNLNISKYFIASLQIWKLFKELWKKFLKTHTIRRHNFCLKAISLSRQCSWRSRQSSTTQMESKVEMNVDPAVALMRINTFQES